MEAFQQRVVEEHKELHDRRAKLGEFIRVNPQFGKLPVNEQKLLEDQHRVMAEYETILDRRIDIFKSKEPRRPDSKE